MQFTERLIRAENRRRLENERQTDFQQDDADEMGYAYRERKPFVFLNQDKGAFESKDETSINTAPSVFEKSTVFHATRDD